MENLDIEAKAIHRTLAKAMSNRDKWENPACFFPAFLAVVALVLGVVFVLAGLIAQPESLSEGPTVWFGSLFLLGGGLTFWFVNAGHRLAMKHRLSYSSESWDATAIYRRLLDQNKIIAKPIVLKIYDLEKRADHGYSVAISERLRLLNKIEKKDRKDRDKAISSVDRSDIEVAESILHGHSALES